MMRFSRNFRNDFVRLYVFQWYLSIVNLLKTWQICKLQPSDNPKFPIATKLSVFAQLSEGYFCHADPLGTPSQWQG
jgi:hypothetical protein